MTWDRLVVGILDDTLAQLTGAQVFSKLDANSGFWQIPSQMTPSFSLHLLLFMDVIILTNYTAKNDLLYEMRKCVIYCYNHNFCHVILTEKTHYAVFVCYFDILLFTVYHLGLVVRQNTSISEQAKSLQDWKEYCVRLMIQ